MRMLAASSIEVTTSSEFVADSSNALAQRYVFAYTITISNNGGVAATLLNRSWIVKDGLHNEQHVEGAGVVGKQPRIEPGTAFTYTSNALLPTSIGSMEGSYEFQLDSGAIFRVPIPRFSLHDPAAIH
ncbi:MAG: Co2+/Mg2+ efflux protein ApaG [Gammaproteobacteria bacterium]|nr:Co2+/Mg2+ efflux protein ApaG [Gammaproteobacteria bacterium]MCY4200473.1 Co2+/Mg2+ efflux protein ApaG [Gammaproteobacteria bacterium]MCY4277505.1 Co2+/Mg2+ efflux protein ApaG [Gammaproteobacteria bacterium]MCY4324008.1 Co2+/Mg2+ efflux protein ApaG [Gammaproteobacteria bacterium]